MQYIFIYFWAVCKYILEEGAVGVPGLAPVAAETLQRNSALLDPLVLYANVITGQMLCGIQTEGLSLFFYDFSDIVR